MVASSAAKSRRLSMVRAPSPSRPLRRKDARSCAHHEFVQERLLPVGRLNNRRAWATRWVASSGRLRPSLSLFAFALRDLGQVSGAIAGLFPERYRAAEP